MEFLRFIFSNVWVWAGFTILLSVIGDGLTGLVKVCKRNRKITGCRIGQHWHLDIENASKEDAQKALMLMAHDGWYTDGDIGDGAEEGEAQGHD